MFPTINSHATKTQKTGSFPKNKFLTTLVMNRHQVTMLVYAPKPAKYKLLRHGATWLHGDRYSNGLFLSHSLSFFYHTYSVTDYCVPFKQIAFGIRIVSCFLSGIGRGEREDDVVGEETTRDEEEKDGS